MKKTARCWSGLYYKTMRCRNSDSSVVLLSNIKTLQRVGGAVAALSKALLVREIVNINQTIPSFPPCLGNQNKSFSVIITMLELCLQLWQRNWNSNVVIYYRYGFYYTDDSNDVFEKRSLREFGLREAKLLLTKRTFSQCGRLRFWIIKRSRFILNGSLIKLPSKINAAYWTNLS